MNQGIKVVKIALLGLGTVGSGVYKLIEEKVEEFEKRTGAKIQIEKILVHNLKKERPGVKKCLLTDQWKEIIENDEIELVIEVMGGIEPAKAMILEALNAGKNVVTANKDLVAEHGKELFEAAPVSKVTFKSSNKKVATVSSKGVVKAKKKGTATITVKCNGITRKFKITVK